MCVSDSQHNKMVYSKIVTLNAVFILDIVLLWEKEAIKWMLLIDTRKTTTEVVRGLSGKHCTDFSYQCTGSLHVVCFH